MKLTYQTKNGSSAQPVVNRQSTVTFTNSTCKRKAAKVLFWTLFDWQDAKRLIFCNIYMYTHQLNSLHNLYVHTVTQGEKGLMKFIRICKYTQMSRQNYKLQPYNKEESTNKEEED